MKYGNYCNNCPYYSYSNFTLYLNATALHVPRILINDYIPKEVKEMATSAVSSKKSCLDMPCSDKMPRTFTIKYPFKSFQIPPILDSVLPKLIKLLGNCIYA